MESKLYLKLNQQNADIIVLKDLIRKAIEALRDQKAINTKLSDKLGFYMENNKISI